MICSLLLTIRNGIYSINYEPQGKICKKKKEEGDSAISNGQNSLPDLLISTKMYEHKSYSGALAHEVRLRSTMGKLIYPSQKIW